MSRLRLIATIALGAITIAIAAPLCQLATGSANASDLETNLPPPAALGLMAGLVFLGLPWLVASRIRLFTHGQLALLFAMFAVALPLVNLGLVRPFFQGLLSYTEEYVITRIDTAGFGYDKQSPAHVPKVDLTNAGFLERDRKYREAGLLSHYQGVATTAAEAKTWYELGPVDRLSWVVFGRETRDAQGRMVKSPGIPWRLWRTPLLVWLGFFAAVLGAFMCLAEWLRRRWIEREHLAFPLVEIADQVIRADVDLDSAQDGSPAKPRVSWFPALRPLGEISAAVRPLHAVLRLLLLPLRAIALVPPMLLAGIAIGGLVVSIEALAYYKILSVDGALSFNLSAKLFTEPPLKFLENVFFILSPIVLGIAYLIALELSFSIWSMFLVMQLVVLVCRAAGMNPDPGTEVGWGASKFPFLQEQGFGVLVAIAVAVLWKGLKTRPTADAAATRPAWQRWLLPVILTLSVALVAGNLWWYGVRSWVGIALILAVIGGIAVVQARLRAETGLPTIRAWPDLTSLVMVLGLGAAIGAGPFAVIATLFFLPLSLLPATLSQQVENFELGRRVGVRPLHIASAGAIAFVVAIVVGGLSYLVLMPMLAGSIKGDDRFSRYGIWTSHFRGIGGLEAFDSPVWPRVAFMILGAAVFAVLVLLRRKLTRFPWHPLAYPLIVLGVNNNFIAPFSKKPDGIEANGTTFLWGSVFVAWLIKLLVVKYGGMATYRRLKPLFIGLVVGSALAFCSWSALHGIAHRLVNQQTNRTPLWQPFLKNAQGYSSGGY